MTADETLEVVALDRGGSRSLSGTVDGYKSKVWAVAVAKGESLTVTFKSSSTNLYMNVIDSADTSGAAVHRGEMDGPNASISATADAVYLVKPFQPRASARRNEKGDYVVTIRRS